MAQVSDSAPPAVITYRVLGPISLSGPDGVAVDLRSDLQRRLLAALVLHANRSIGPDQLADLLWGDDLPGDVRGALHTHVSRLRRRLPTGGLVTGDGGYRLTVSPDDLDAVRFTALVETAARRRDDPAAALVALDGALALWRGPAYAEFVDWDAARAESTRLDELRLAAQEERADALLVLGRLDDALAALRPLTAEEPLRERSQALLMTALYRAGRQPEALRAYEAHRRRLADELGLDPSPALRDLERAILEHRLEPPEEVVAPELGGTLPAPASPLLGRGRELGELAVLLRSARVVTLSGPGGVGKTRLAIETARAAQAEFDRAAFCELGLLERDEDVAAAVATTLGVEPRAGVSVDERIVEVLRNRRVLVVLDNCEHVIEAAARLVERVVAMTTAVTVLATSRERLAVAGEHVHAVEPLDDADALDLFVQRAGAVRAGFAPSESEESDALYICHRLDRLPLAIELAAARAQAFSVREIADSLSQRFRVLTGGRRAEARHRSLREAVRWSFDLLDDDERRLCERLAVFAGGFDAATAAIVAGLDPLETADLIGRLVERSLVTAAPDRPGRPSRYGMFETVRQYGSDALAERGELDDVLRSFAHAVVARAVERERALSTSVGAGTAMADFDDELANLRAAHAWLVDAEDVGRLAELEMSLYWYGLFAFRPEVFSWAEAGLAEGAPGDACRPDLLAVAAMGRWQRGDFPGATAAIEEGLALAGPGTMAHSHLLGLLGGLAGWAGDTDVALAALEESTAEAEVLGDRMAVGVNRLQWLQFAAMGGRDVDATAEAWVAEAEATGNPLEACWTRYAAGEVLAVADPDRARMHLDRALELAAVSGCSFVAGVAGVTRASIESRRGDPAEAARRYRELFEHWRRGPVRPVIETMLRAVCELLDTLGEPLAAATVFGAAWPSGPDAVPGPDGALGVELEERLRRRVGDEEFDAAVAEGASLGDDDLLDRAATALEPS